MVARDAALAGYEDGRIHIQHLSARESVEAVADGQGARRAGHLRGLARTTCCSTDEDVRGRSTRGMKMNPPLRTEDDRQALIDGPARRHDRLHRHRPRAARARGEGGARSSRRRWARPAWRPRSPRVYTGLVAARGPAAGAARRAADRGRRAARTCRRRRSRVGEPGQPDAGRPRRPSGRSGEARLRDALGELLLRRPRRCSGRVLLTIAAGGVRRLPRARPSTRGAPHDAPTPTSCSRTAPASTATPCGADGHADRRGRLHDRHVRLPGVDDRPVASPAS